MDYKFNSIYNSITRRLNGKKCKGWYNAAFTLEELLIVVAVISVLLAVAIPVFTSQLDKSKRAVDE